MDSAPGTTPDQEVDTDEDESSWSDLGYAVLCLALAVVPFTPLWDQIAQPDSTRRRYGGISRFLDSVGPLPVTLVFGTIGVALVVGAIVKRSRRRDAEAAQGDEG